MPPRKHVLASSLASLRHFGRGVRRLPSLRRCARHCIMRSGWPRSACGRRPSCGGSWRCGRRRRPLAERACVGCKSAERWLIRRKTSGGRSSWSTWRRRIASSSSANGGGRPCSSSTAARWRDWPPSGGGARRTSGGGRSTNWRGSSTSRKRALASSMGSAGACWPSTSRLSTRCTICSLAGPERPCATLGYRLPRSTPTSLPSLLIECREGVAHARHPPKGG
mmetsp:Transcript_128119/g.410724  ORF Transcript_128119/g.410724 Transcript_128119/m.410724 type:complete len:223 (+) Transcript_128119:931-1599(+)